MKRFFYAQKTFLLALSLLVIYACKEEIDTSARYVFKYDTVMSYLVKHEAYNEYVKLLEVVPISRLSVTVMPFLVRRS